MSSFIISQRLLTLRSLESGFHMIVMIVMIAAIAELFFSAIIWKPGLSYSSYVSITIILSKQEGCIMLFTYSGFNCRNENGLLNYVVRE